MTNTDCAGNDVKRSHDRRDTSSNNIRSTYTTQDAISLLAFYSHVRVKKAPNPTAEGWQCRSGRVLRAARADRKPRVARLSALTSKSTESWLHYTFRRYVERVRHVLTSSRVYLALFDAIKRGRAREQPNLNSQHVKNHFSVSAYLSSNYERERSP